MTGSSDPRRRVVLAALLWLVLAFCVWNVRFDYGVRVSADAFLAARTAYLRGRGPRVELKPAMTAGIAESARSATLIALPQVLVGLGLAWFARRPVR